MPIVDRSTQTRHDLERQLDDTLKALTDARLATFDKEPNIDALAAERDRTLARRIQLRDLLAGLRTFVAPRGVPQDRDGDLLREINRVRAELADAERDDADAADKRQRAVGAYNRAVHVHHARHARVRMLEGNVQTLQREVERAEPRQLRSRGS